MKESTALLWKEWRESRVYLLIGLIIFLGFPFIAAVEFTFHTNRIFEIHASEWVFYFGGVLAVFVAVGATCRDLTGRLEDFWRSRPISVTRWLMVKYAVGLLVILTCCEVPLIVEVWLNRDKYAAEYLIWYPFLWTALYSVGFLAGCLIRRASHAATLGLAGLLMVYLVPVIIPPLEWLSTSSLGNGYSSMGEWPALCDHHEPFFASGMGGLALVCTVVAIASIRYDWHIKSGQKLMYALVSGALLLVFASAAFQLGTNLPILQQIDLGVDEHIRKIAFDGKRGHILSWHGDWDQMNWNQSQDNLRLRPIQMSQSGITLGSPIVLNKNQWDALLTDGYRNLKISDEVSCRIDYVDSTQSDGPIELRLSVFSSIDGSQLSDCELWTAKDYQYEPSVYLYLWNGHVYVVGTHLLILDISNPRDIKKLIDNKIPFAEQRSSGSYSYPRASFGQDRIAIYVPPLPDLPPELRLAQAVRGFDWQADQNILVSQLYGIGIDSYRLTSFVKSLATFEIRSEYKPSLLERTFSTGGFSKVRMGHLLYQEGRPERTFNGSISVFDLNPRGVMPMVGHFAAPKAKYVCPLADGRAIVGGGDKIWLVGPPPRSSR